MPEKREKTLRVRVTPTLYEQVKQCAEKTGVPYSFVVRKALEMWVSSKEFWKEEDE